MPLTLRSGERFPRMTFQKVGGGQLLVGEPSKNWTLLVVYRGRHCGRCKKYLNGLEKMRQDWERAGFDIVVVSADTQEKAQADIAEFGWTFNICYGLVVEQMKLLGLYVSEPLSEAETDRVFAEPGVFCITPEGNAQIVSVSNGPAARPELAELLDGMIFTIENNRPPRGTWLE